MHVVQYNGHKMVVVVVVLRYLFNGLFSRTTWVSRHQNGKAVDVEDILAQAQHLFASLSIIYWRNTIKYTIILIQLYYDFQFLEFTLRNHKQYPGIANKDKVFLKNIISEATDALVAVAATTTQFFTGWRLFLVPSHITALKYRPHGRPSSVWHGWKRGKVRLRPSVVGILVFRAGKERTGQCNT